MISLVAMSVGFFIIAVVALLLFLTQLDKIKNASDAIEELEAEKELWKLERDSLVKKKKEAQNALVHQQTRKQEVSIGYDDYQSSPKYGSPPPLPQLEQPSNARWMRNQVISKALRLVNDNKLPVYKSIFDKWIRFLIIRGSNQQPRSPGPRATSQPRQIVESGIRPVEYYSIQHHCSPPKFLNFGASSQPQYPSFNQMHRSDVYSPGGTPAQFSYPSAIRHVRR